MLINAQLRSKQEEIQPVRCDIACIVELSNAEFFDSSSILLLTTTSSKSICLI